MEHRGTMGPRDVPAGKPAEVTGRQQVAAAPVSYTTGAAAKMCGVSQQTIIRCFDSGQLKGFRVPGSKFRRITRAGLLTFMLECGIATDPLGSLSPDEAAEVARKVGEPRIEQTTLRLTTPDRFEVA